MMSQRADDEGLVIKVKNIFRGRQMFVLENNSNMWFLRGDISDRLFCFF